jgi:RNA polymerase sigma-70 factor (ECF subfamily)
MLMLGPVSALSMDQTRSTLLSRLRDPSDQDAWRTFDRLYRPLIVGYACCRGLSEADAEDVGQQCAQAVLEQIHRYQHLGSFKSWLRSIAEHKVIDAFRRRRQEVRAETTMLERRADPEPGSEEFWERQWRGAHLRYCAERARQDVAETTYSAFVAYAIEGLPVAAVAQALGMTPNQVYVAKHRVMERIRMIMTEITGVEELDAA